MSTSKHPRGPRQLPTLLILLNLRLSIDCRGTLVTCYRTMEHPQVPEGSSSLIQLPDELLAAVINTLTRHALGNPGDVCRLMLVGHIAQPVTKADLEPDS